MIVDRLGSYLRKLNTSLGLDGFPIYRQEGTAEATVPFLSLFVVFTCFVHVVETYLDYRQHRNLGTTSPPSALLTILKRIDEADSTGDLKAVSKTESKFAAAQSYGLDKSRFHFVKSSFDLIFGLATNLLGWMPWLWDVSVGLLVKAGLNDKGGDIPTSLVFMGLIYVLQTITEMPFSLYSTFVVEQRHGFNKMTLKLFFVDQVKGAALAAFIATPIVACILKIIEWGGKYFYVYLWVFVCLVNIVMVVIAPVVIMPLFNKYTPLEDGELKSRIEELAKSVSFPLTNLFVVDGSKRSAHSNAYFYGFFKNKRIVLFDTLIKQANTTEIVSILGHELGHWKMWHTLQQFAICQVYNLVAFSGFGLATELDRSLRHSFGYATSAKFVSLYLFFAVLWAPVDTVLEVLMNVLSRKNEFQADDYAVKLGYTQGLQSGLVKLQLENLGNMNPDPWYSAFHYSHPPLVERLQAMSDSTALKKTD